MARNKSKTKSPPRLNVAETKSVPKKEAARTRTSDVAANASGEQNLIGRVTRWLLSTVVGITLLSIVGNHLSSVIPNIFERPRITFVIVFILGIFTPLSLFWIHNSGMARRGKIIGLSAVTILVAGGLVLNYLFHVPNQTYSTDSKVSPVIIPTGYFSYSQPEFAVALPNHVSPNRFASFKMQILSTFDGDFNNAEIENPEDIGLIIIAVAQVGDKEQLELDEFSRNSTNQVVERFITTSNDPNASTEMVEQGYTSILGRNAKKMTLRMRATDSKSGQVKTADFRILSFADEKTLRGYMLMYIPTEETEKVISTFNIL